MPVTVAVVMPVTVTVVMTVAASPAPAAIGQLRPVIPTLPRLRKLESREGQK